MVALVTAILGYGIFVYLVRVLLLIEARGYCIVRYKSKVDGWTIRPSAPKFTIQWGKRPCLISPQIFNSLASELDSRTRGVKTSPSPCHLKVDRIMPCTMNSLFASSPIMD